MPEVTLGRDEQGVDRHLAAAAAYIKIAESGDAEKSAYEHAADEILAVVEEQQLSQAEVARRIGRDPTYVATLLKWRRGGSVGAVFGGRKVVDSQTRWAAKKAAREDPDMFAAAFDAAPPEAKRQIAERISRAPEVRSEARRRDVEAEQRQRPESIPPRDDTRVLHFEQRLVGARRYIRDALDLVNGIERPGDDEDILELIEMLKQMVDAVDESYRSGKSLDSWAWELYERSAD